MFLLRETCLKVGRYFVKVLVVDIRVWENVLVGEKTVEDIKIVPLYEINEI